MVNVMKRMKKEERRIFRVARTSLIRIHAEYGYLTVPLDGSVRA